MNKLLLFILLLVGATSCQNYILIERSEAFINEKKELTTIICIDPEVKILDLKDNIDRDANNKLQPVLEDAIQYASAKLDFKLDLKKLDESSTKVYYNDLLSLKKDFLMANRYQDTPLNFRTSPNINSISKSYFVYPPQFSFEYASLSSTFNTPYFSYMGLYKYDGKVLLYHLIVNTNTSETIYREVKRIGTLKTPKKKKLRQAVYDSFAMLKMELK